ncbi:MAG: two-component sensor histidine kinase [Deltaproteobacteria bacterium]|nr:two-component sensor histidine kinase [Deltaproteobacteria bacterium]
MSSAVAFTIASAVAFLSIALLAAMRRTTYPLAIHLSLMCVGLFAYHGLDALGSLTGEPHWDWLSYAVAALTAIPTLNLLVAFVGRRRELRWPLGAFALFFVGVSLATLSPFAVPELGDFPASDGWAVLMLAGLVPGFGPASYLLVRHARQSTPEERARCQLLAGAMLLGVGGAILDLVLIAGGSALRLSPFAFVASAILVALLVLKARILEGVTALTFATATVLAIMALIAQLLVFTWAEDRATLLVFGSLCVILLLVAALRPLARTLSAQRVRSEYLATLGRFSAQMAHDIRNPLAAIRGAAQFLQEEHAQGRPLEPHMSFVEMILERTGHLNRVIRDYQRMGRVEPVFNPLDVNQLVEGVLANQLVSCDDTIVAHRDLAEDLPECAADRDLLEHALDNLVRNALEAMPEGGELHASTGQARRGTSDHIRIAIRDTGTGMDVRTREHALDDFFTTKPQGSGLGLAYIARVVDAHGGKLTLDSREGRGTTVTLELPVAPRLPTASAEARGTD